MFDAIVMSSVSMTMRIIFISVFDASGKPARGLLKGNTQMHGSFDMCMEISHSFKYAANNTQVTRTIEGGYCGMEIGLPPGVMPPVPGEVSNGCRQNRC